MVITFESLADVVWLGVSLAGCTEWVGFRMYVQLTVRQILGITELSDTANIS